MSVRGETENLCLEFVKSNIEKVQFFGFDTDEIELVKSIIKTAVPNENLNDFPDFVSPNGIIEHFEVNASKTTSKGSKQKAELSGQEKVFKVQKSILRYPYSKEFMEKELGILKYPIAFSNPPQTYDYFFENIKKSYRKHCRSLSKYLSEHNKPKIVFLIEFNYNLFYMKAKKSSSNSDEYMFEYKLSKDKNILQYFYSVNNNEVDYILLANGSNIEMIKISSVPNIVKEIDCEYDIRPYGRLVTINEESILKTI